MLETNLPKIHVYELHEWVPYPARAFDSPLFFAKLPERISAELQNPLNKWDV